MSSLCLSLLVMASQKRYPSLKLTEEKKNGENAEPKLFGEVLL